MKSQSQSLTLNKIFSNIVFDLNGFIIPYMLGGRSWFFMADKHSYVVEYWFILCEKINIWGFRFIIRLTLSDICWIFNPGSFFPGWCLSHLHPLICITHDQNFLTVILKPFSATGKLTVIIDSLLLCCILTTFTVTLYQFCCCTPSFHLRKSLQSCNITL